MSPAPTNGSSGHHPSARPVLPVPLGPPQSFAPPVPAARPAAKPKVDKRPRPSAKSGTTPNGPGGNGGTKVPSASSQPAVPASKPESSHKTAEPDLEPSAKKAKIEEPNSSAPSAQP